MKYFENCKPVLREKSVRSVKPVKNGAIFFTLNMSVLQKIIGLV